MTRRRFARWLREDRDHALLLLAEAQGIKMYHAITESTDPIAEAQWHVRMLTHRAWRDLTDDQLVAEARAAGVFSRAFDPERRLPAESH